MNSTIYRLNSSCTISLFFVPLFYFGQMSAQTSEKGWELRKDKNGIRVFTMLETGNDIKSYKVMFSVDHPKHVLEKVLTDVDKMADWTANLEVCEIVGRENDSVVYSRSVFDAPWPIDDREAVMRVTKSNVSKDVVTVTSTCAADKIADDGEYVRVQNSYGQWTITQVEPNKCDLIYQGYSDPAGAIPDWLVNSFSVDVPYGSAENLREYLDEEFK